MEKGVDTLLTMDLMALPKDIKKIILVACDSDYVPIIAELKARGVEVILYHYTDRVRGSRFSTSNHLTQACSHVFQLKYDHFDAARR